jgi:hypothetical protein
VEDLASWGERALAAVRSGSAWERYDFDLREGESIGPVIETFGAVTRSLGVDCADACAMLYVPVSEGDAFPELSELDPWRDILVPQLYICSPSTVAAWVNRGEAWTPPMRDPRLGEGLTMRGLTVQVHGTAAPDTYRHLVVRREANSPPRFDTLD